MGEFNSTGIYDAIRDLMMVAVVVFAHYLGKELIAESSAKNPERKNLWRGLIKGFFVCALIAGAASANVGQPSCAGDSDPLYGGCDLQSNDGYVPTSGQRNSTFVHIFLILYLPFSAGLTDRVKR